MIVNLVSDINTESVLKAFSNRPAISIHEFYNGLYFNNVTESNYSGLKLHKTIDSLLAGGYLEAPSEYEQALWRITPKGGDHLAFLERPDVKEIETVKEVPQIKTSFKIFKSELTIRRDTTFILRAIYLLLLQAVSRSHKAQ